MSRTHVVLAALAGLVSVGVSLLFQLAPTLRPDPRDEVGAEVNVAALERGATIGEWIDRGFRGEQRRELDRLYREQRAFPGQILYVKVAVDGHKHKDVLLQYRLYDARSQRALRALESLPFPPRLRIEAPRERSVQLIFLPDLTLEPDVLVRMELSDEGGMLAVTDSAPIVRGRLSPD